MADETSDAGGLTWRSRVVWLPALILLLVGSCVGIVAVSAASDPSSQGCTGLETVDVVAAPSVAPALQEAASSWKKTTHPGGVCVDVHITARSSADAVAELSRSDAQPPDVWIPDSSEWVQKLRRDTNGRVTPVQSLWLSPAIASSPLVLAASPKDARRLNHTAAGGWSKVLSGGTPISLADPSTSTEGLLLLAAAQGALGASSGTPTHRLVSSLVALSTGVVGDDPAQVLKSSPAHPVAVSEQDVINANGSGNAGVQAVYPRDVGLSLDFPVAEFAPPERSPSQSDAVTTYVESLYQPPAQRALRADGLRDAKGSAFASTVDFQGIAPTAVIPPQSTLTDRQMTSVARVWSAAQRRNRTLVVVDVSGSMIGPKIRFASAAVASAVRYLPDDARIGLWAFSTKLHGSSPWRRLVTLGALGSPSDPSSRRPEIRAATGELPGLAAKRGNTGLYRTTLDAYRDVRRGFDPNRYNSVVLLTDGANTAAGPTRAELLSRLRAGRSSSRPLRIFTVAIGPDADRETLKRIADATGGTEFNVDTIADIRDVFLDAVIKEGS